MTHCAPQRRRRTNNSGALAQLAPLTLRETAPDAEPLIVLERVLEAAAAHLARRADLLGVAGRAALLREEGLGVGLRAQRVGLPRERVLVVFGRELANAGNTQLDGVDEPVVRNTRAIPVVRHVSVSPPRMTQPPAR